MIDSSASSHRSDNLVERLRFQFETYGDSRTFTFLHESGRTLVEEVAAFRDLDRGAREVAAWLSSRHDARQPVLLLFEPGLDFWRAFLGCLYAGVIAIPAPLPHDSRSMQRVAGILRDADSSLALTTAKLRDLLTKGIDGLGLNRPIVFEAIDDSQLADPDSWTVPHTTADTVAFLQYTSGSTGDPKGVVVSHANMLHNAETISEALGVSARSVLVGWIPHFHDMGLIGQLVAFLNGANLVTMSPLTFLKQPVRLLRAISDYRGTISTAPNFAYDLIARRVTPEQLTGLDLSTWEVALNGAEPVRRRGRYRRPDQDCAEPAPSSGTSVPVRRDRERPTPAGCWGTTAARRADGTAGGDRLCGRLQLRYRRHELPYGARQCSGG
jgi:acyl-CoA synthetase (AMP-forming)/AMP-acid ligase II